MIAIIQTGEGLLLAALARCHLTDCFTAEGLLLAKLVRCQLIADRWLDLDSRLSGNVSSCHLSK